MTMHHGSYRRLLLFLVLFISSQQISGQTSYEYCPSFTCGGVEVRYPFRDSSKKDIQYCGYEGLNVACSEDNKTLTFATLTDNYTVKAIDHHKETISLFDTDVKDEKCPKVQHGFNISNIPVLSTDPEVVVNLTFFFGCNLSIGDPPIPTGFPADQATCLDNGDEKAFVFAGEVNPRWKDWLSQSCSGGEVVSPVMKKGVTQTNVSELFPNYLKEGFQLKWENSDKADCRKCENSGGRCGYSDKAGAGLESVCFCKEGTTYRGDCNSSGSGTNIITILVVIVSVSIALICASLLCCFFKSKSKKRKGSLQERRGLLSHMIESVAGDLMIWISRSGTTKEVEEELKQERANLSFFEFELLVPPPATSATVTGLDGAALASSTRLDLPLPCHTGSSFISPYPTMGSEATTLLFLLLLFPHLTLPCPVEWLSCEQGAEMNQDGGEKICGHDNFKCVNSTLYIKFHGKGNWYTAVEIRYPEKTLTVRDESLVKRLPSKDNCSFLYNFTSPIQNFDPSVFTSADSTASFFDCKANKYNFTADAFETEYNSSYCADYNLYYSYEGGMANTSPPDDDDCLLDTNATTPAVEWKLSFEDDASGGVRFILLSAGFSLRRKISPTCFSCKMSKGHCGSAKNNSSETSPYCNCNLKCPARVSGTKKTKIITIAVVIVSVSVALICAPLLCCFFKSKSKKRKGATKKVEEELKQERANLSFFEFELLVAATGNFSDGNRIGRGGFGIVYKGKLANGLEIAVKRLSNISRQGLQEFKNEVKVMAKLQHKNLVKLLGYCLRREEKILIYEFLPNGSLDSFFSDNERRTLLDWKKRFNIIKGIAKGLLYLHEDSGLRIIHRDLKAGNILLDKDMNPKISDFGMARIFGGNQNEAETVRVVGTYGYMSPEYAMKGHFSMKSDVYSYGILVLEILSGKRNTSFHSSSFQTLLSYAWQLWEDNLQVELMDPSMVGVYEMDNVLRCLHVALLCVQDCANDRPTMSWVVHMLENPFVPLDRQPKQPTFTAVVDDIAQNPGVKIPQSVFSINELTITNVDGR